MTEKRDSRETLSPRARRAVRWLLVAGGSIAYIVVGCLALINIPRDLLTDWLPNATTEERGKLLGVAGQLVLVALGGAIAVVGVAVSLSRHSEELASAQRDRDRLEHDRLREAARRSEVQDQRSLEVERDLRSRYVTAVELLADAERPIKQIAAIHALGSLADDWKEVGRSDEVQVCINVVTDHLRAPSTASTPEARASELAVRTAGFDLIRSHLQRERRNSWSNQTINLEGLNVHLNLDLSGIYLGEHGSLKLNRARVEEDAYIDLTDSHVQGRVDLRGAEIRPGGMIRLNGLEADGAAELGLSRLQVRQSAALYLGKLSVRDRAKFFLEGVRVEARGILSGHGIAVGGFSEVRASGLDLASSSRVQFPSIEISGHGKVVLRGMKLGSGAKLDLGECQVLGSGTLDLKMLRYSDMASLSLMGFSVSDLGKILMDGASIRGENSMEVTQGELGDIGPILISPSERFRPSEIGGAWVGR